MPTAPAPLRAGYGGTTEEDLTYHWGGATGESCRAGVWSSHLPAVVTLPDGSWFVDVDLNDGSENSTEPDAPRTVNVRSAKWAACVAGLLRDHGNCIVIVTDMHA